MNMPTIELLIAAHLLAIVAVCTAEPSVPTSLPAGVTYVTSVEGVHEYRLGNGLQVLLIPDASKPTITVNVTYLVGSRHENYGETGMAHLLEHLMFKGTPTHPKIPQAMKERGAMFSGTTTLDRTNYFETLAATPENLQWAIELEADRMINSFIARKDLDSEMTVVRNEFEMGENDPTNVLLMRMGNVGFDWHSYGRPPIGNRSDIENVRIENLQAFYRTYYQPDNAALVIGGKFEPAQALEMVTAAFGKIPRPTRQLPPFWTVEPTQEGERSVVIRRKDDTVVVAVGYKVPSELNADSAAISLGNSILVKPPAGRLHKLLVETGRAVSVFGGRDGGVATGMQIFVAQVKKGEPIEPVRDALIEAVESFGQKPPTEDELQRARTKWLNATERLLSDADDLTIQLSASIALGDWRMLFKQRDDIEAATSQQIAEAAARYYRRDNRTVGLFIPEESPQRTEIPAPPSVAQVMKDYRPKAAMAAGETFDPTPANIQARTRLERIDGLKIAMLSKKNRGQLVTVKLRLNWGNEKSLVGKQSVSALAFGLLSRGTENMSREQIADAMTRLKMNGDITDFVTTRENLPEALRLAARSMRDASFPESEFEQLKREQLADLTSDLNDPMARARDAINAHFNHHPRGDFRNQPSISERIDELRAVTREDVVRFHRDFLGASDGQIAIVGDFDSDAAKQIIEQELANWKTRTSFAPPLDSFVEIAGAKFELDTPDKENGFLLARLNVNLRDDAPDYASLLVANHILGGGLISSRLADRLRQRDGLSYRVGSSLRIGSLDNAGRWTAYALAAPQNLGKAETALREELVRAVQEGLSSAEVTAAVGSLLQQRAQNRSMDNHVAQLWNDLMYADRQFGEWESKLDAAIASVTVESANAALRKYIAPTKVSIAIAADPDKRK